MQKQPFPKFKHTMPGLAALLAFLLWILEQYAAGSDWWVKMPWGVLAIALAAFTAGAFYSDLLNRQSKLRLWWRYRTQLFEVSALHTGDALEPKRIIIRGLFRFVRGAKNARLSVTGVTHTLNPRPVILFQENLGDMLENQEHEVIFGNLIIQEQGWGQEHSVWGRELGGKDLKDGQKSISGGKHTLTMTVKSGWRKQSLTFILHTVDNSQAAKRYIQLWFPDEDLEDGYW